MKRKLAHQDLSKVKQFLEQLDIEHEKVTFDLAEGSVESDEPPPAYGEAGFEEGGHDEEETGGEGPGGEEPGEGHGVYPGEDDSAEEGGRTDEGRPNEEENIAEIAQHANLPQPTALRHIHNCRNFFETERGVIASSPYNVKLLKVLDGLFSEGLTVPQVIRELREGKTPVSLPDSQQESGPGPGGPGRREASPFPFPGSSSPNTAVDHARKYFEAPRPFDFSSENELEDMEDMEDMEEWEFGPPPRRSVVKWILLILIPLIVIAVLMGYHLGYLGSGRVEPEADPHLQDPPPPALIGEKNEETDETDKPGEIGEAPENEEDAAGEAKEDEERDEYIEPALQPGEITVDVLNGCGVRGIAGHYAEKLREEGYQVREVRDADHFTYTRSQVINRLEEGEPRSLMELFNQPVLNEEEPVPGEPMITVIVGEDDAV